VIDRLRLAKAANVPEVFYGLYVGLTTDHWQIAKAVELYREFPQVVGLKLYACPSIGSLNVSQWHDQLRIYETLKEECYDGVLVVHCEKEELFIPELWNHKKPESHCSVRSEVAEFNSVEDQIKLANITMFEGRLHICHVSSPRAVELISWAKRNLSLDISCSVCPHHFIFDREQMKKPNGYLWKMNPPLRDHDSAYRLFFCLLTGMIDWIETDHAPHTLEEKMPLECLSGIPGLPWWPNFIEYLRRNGFSETHIEDLTFNNAAKRFGIDIKKSNQPLIYRGDDYAFNPYEELMKEEVIN